MEVTIIDILEGSSGTLNRIRGWSFDRKFTVDGVTGSKHEKVFQAYNADGMPQIGDPHPSVPKSILDNFSGVTVSGKIVTGVLKYRTPDWTIPTDDDVVINTGSTLSQVETNKAADGTILTTAYQYPADYKENISLRDETVTQPALISKLVPQSTRTMTRIEADDPLVKSSIYVGKVNSENFLEGFPKTWMCTGITGTSLNGGVTYNVAYDFQYRHDTWDETIVFIDPQTAHPPVLTTGAEVAAGIVSYQIYQTIDFNNLSLT